MVRYAIVCVLFQCDNELLIYVLLSNMTRSHNIDFNGLRNTIERISADVRFLDEEQMVKIRCGVTQRNSLVCLQQ